MASLKKHLHTYHFLSVIIHLAVYLPFFAVQFLYNFDIGAHDNTLASSKAFAHIETISAKNTQKLSKDTGQSPVKAKTRLNKRFQPESIIVFHIYHSTQPIQWLTSFKPKPVNTALHSFLLSFNQPLRGPPQVICLFS